MTIALRASYLFVQGSVNRYRNGIGEEDDNLIDNEIQDQNNQGNILEDNVARAYDPILTSVAPQPIINGEKKDKSKSKEKENNELRQKQSGTDKPGSIKLTGARSLDWQPYNCYAHAAAPIGTWGRQPVPSSTDTTAFPTLGLPKLSKT